jgi:hypothetical protein
VIMWMILKVGKLVLCCEDSGCCAGGGGGALDFGGRSVVVWLVIWRKVSMVVGLVL